MDLIKPFDSNVQLLGKVLDLRAKKSQVISANIANAETPGFSPSRFNFEEDLSAALNNTKGVQLVTSHQAHIPLGPSNFNSISGKVIVEEDQSKIGDGNGVSVDQEMIDLSENALLYETAAQLLKKKMSLIKHVISGGQ